MDGTLAKQEETIENKEKKLNKFKVIDGGLIGGEPPTVTGNWLKDLKVGTVFLAQPKVDMKDFNLLLFRLEGKEGPHSEVVCLRNPNVPQELYVDPMRFVRMYDLHLTIGIMESKDNDNNRDTTPTGDKNTEVEGSPGAEEKLSPIS